MRFIGDIHGKFNRYEKLVKECEASIQVGDFGMGFKGGKQHPWSYKKDYAFYKHHRFIRGNHDSPAHCASQASRWWIPDGTVEDGMMFCGGANSVDKATRMEGVDWWRNEELSIHALNNLIDKYERDNPNIMVTHEAPESVAQATMTWRSKLELGSRTRQAFQAMLEMRKPKLWIFGHWHKSIDTVIDGCRFICLNELEHIDIDLAEYRS